MTRFVEHYNSALHTRYAFERVLDSTGPAKAPEASFTDAHGHRVVVERKSLISPQHFAQRHSSMHQVSDIVSAALPSHLDPTAPYRLTIRDGLQARRRDIQRFAERIVTTIVNNVARLNAGDVIESSDGLTYWCFARERPSDRDFFQPSAGLVFSFENGIHRLNPDFLPSGLTRELRRLLGEAHSKFSHYLDAQRILVLDPYGDVRHAQDATWATLLESVAVPSTIGEIWMSMHDKVTDLHCGWIHKRLWPEMSSDNSVMCDEVKDSDEQAARGER